MAFEWGSFTEQLEYLKSRGFDEITIKRMGVEIVTSAKLEELGIKRAGITRGILWKLKDIKGEMTFKYGARVWYQQGWFPTDEKPKFLPPKGQIPGLYFTPLADWNKMEYGQKVYICESYLKADLLGMLGYHALGISGVWGWSYDKQLNWDFQSIDWKGMGLQLIITFDSNVRPDKGHLFQAAAKLRVEMDIRHHIEAKIIQLPPNGDADWGIDDYFSHHGKTLTLALLNSEPTALPNELREHLKVMNTEVCMIQELGKVVHMRDGYLMGKGHFEDMAFADRMAIDQEGKRQPVAKIWTRWDGRNVVKRMVYAPGEVRLKEGDFFNSWEGMGCEPVAADVTFFTSWMTDAFSASAERSWILDWWAWQLQNLGKKSTMALVIVGPPGVGKGWLTRIVELIYGAKNVSKIPIGVLDKNFNAEIAQKQLLVVEETDEVSGKNQVIYNKLKDMITSTTIRLEKKGLDAQFIENTVNVFLTGNQVGIFKLDTDDRRFAIFDASNAKGIANSSDYWKPRWDWIERGGGASAIYAWLLQRDVSKFDAYASAPMTQAKQDMIEVTHGDLDKWVEELKVDYKSVLQVHGVEIDGRLATSKELMWVYLGGDRPIQDITKRESEAMGRALKNARIPVASAGAKIKVKGVPNRYFLLSGEDSSDNWAGEVASRKYFGRLVASNSGQVASESKGGNPEVKW